MLVDDLDINVIDDLGPAEHDLENICVSLESLGSGVAAIYSDVKESLRGINRNVAIQINELDDTILPARYPTNSFTLQTSLTNLKPALEALEGKTIAIIAAIGAAIAAFIYKVYSWLTKTNSSIGSSAGDIVAKVTETETAVDERKDIIAGAKKELTAAQISELKKNVSDDPKTKAAIAQWGRDYNQLIHFAWNRSGEFDISAGFKETYQVLTKMILFIEHATNSYVSMINKPHNDHFGEPNELEKKTDEWLAATSTKSIIFTSVYPGMDPLIRQLEKFGLKANASIKDSILRTEELAGRIKLKVQELRDTPEDLPKGVIDFWDDQHLPIVDMFKNDRTAFTSYLSNKDLDAWEEKIKRINDRVEKASKQKLPPEINPDLVRQISDLRKVIAALMKIIVSLISAIDIMMTAISKYLNNNIMYVRTTSKVISVTIEDS